MSLSLFKHPGFPEWFHRHYGHELPEDPVMLPGDCEGCGAKNVPLLEHHCGICLAESYGQARSEQRLAFAIRDFLHAMLTQPPQVAHQIVGDLLDTFLHATPPAPDAARGATADK